MSTNSSIKFDQLKDQITRFNIDDKIELIRILEKDTFPVRFRNLLDKFKTSDLSIEEITAEVEIVRKQRYNAAK